MSARCRVCHRPLKNPAHIAAGIGPDCAKKAARRASVTDGAAKQVKMFYPRERYDLITRKYTKLVSMLDLDWSEDDREMVLRWCERWRQMQWQAYRMMTYGYRSQQWRGIRRVAA